MDILEACDPCDVLEASDAVDPSIEPLAEPGDCALLNGVEGRDILPPAARGTLVPGGGGAAERTTSMKSWICSERESKDGCEGTFLDTRLFVKRTAVVGEASPDRGDRLLKKLNREGDTIAVCLPSRDEDDGA